MDQERSTQRKGCFITFEGTEGAGKSTQITAVAKFLRDQGLDVVTTREPGGTALGEEIRSLLLNSSQRMGKMTELLLMFAARAEHLTQIILPAINSGKWVLCDRFTESSYAYQGYGRGMSLERIAALEQLVQGDFRPDCTFWFDIPVEEGMRRVNRRGEQDRFETESLAFFESIARGFQALATERPTQFYRIDATQSIAAVTAVIKRKLTQLLAHQSEMPQYVGDL